MKAFIASLIIINILSGCAEKKEQKKVERVVQEYNGHFQQIKRSLIAKYNADTSWVKRLLGNESFRLYSIKTIEVEKAWLEKNPILFEGNLTDISSINENDYFLEFGLSDLQTNIYIDEHDVFFLKVRFPKTKIDTLLKEYPELLKDYLPVFSHQFLIVAKIDSIAKTITFKNENYINIRFGIGEGYDLKIVK